MTGTAGVFVPTGSMMVGREATTATLLRSGQVLVAGGWVHSQVDDTEETTSAELYDPKTGSFTPTGSMNISRQGHTATLLDDGKVLIAGGYRYGGAPVTAEIYDPDTGTFTVTGNLSNARLHHTATLLGNGQVLIVGGSRGITDPPVYPLAAELYDPSSGTFATTGSMEEGRADHTATLLENGMVLVAGGAVETSYFTAAEYTAGAELYDPALGQFAPTGRLSVTRAGHTATLLPSGAVLVAGGLSDAIALASTELYDPSTGKFTVGRDMTVARAGHTATLLLDGDVLVAAGMNGNGGIATAERYESAAGRFAATGGASAGLVLTGAVATLLPNGNVLLVGGGTWSNAAELYQ